MTLTFSTEGVEPRRRLDFWRSSLSTMYAPFEVQDCSVDGFRSEITSTQVDRLNVAQVDGVAQTNSRPKHLIKSGHSDDYVAIVHLDGIIAHSTNGREAVTRPGSITLYDPSKPCALRATGILSIMDISISREDLDGAFPAASNSAGLSIDPSQQTWTPMIVGFFRSLLEQGHLANEVTASKWAGIGLDLLAAAYAEKIGREPLQPMRSATYIYQAKVFIDASLGDFDLNVAAVANHLRISTRQLYIIFAEHDLTVNTYIWARRLEKAYRMLRDPAHVSLSIASIGYYTGFSDPAHFARRFRGRYSMTPTECRQEVGLQRASF